MLKVGIIGSGFAGLSAAAYLAKEGHEVTVFEKNGEAGGRARTYKEGGYTFDMGPSWYWMPEVFEKFFSDFGKESKDYYDLTRLDPSYRVFFESEQVDVPSNPEKIVEMAESLDPGSGKRLTAFLREAKNKYEVAMNGFVQKPSLSALEFINLTLIKKAVKLHLFRSFSRLVKKVTSEPRLKAILEFPILFLGSTARKTPSLYSIMNHADMNLGTWYPMGGMNKVVSAFHQVCTDLGVRFMFNSTVESVIMGGEKAIGLKVNDALYPCDVIIGGADYAHTESLLPVRFRAYSDAYWKSRKFAPSCIIYYLGVSKKIEGLQHHNLFFDADMESHSSDIYVNHSWPKKPLFYVCCPSKTDTTVAPENSENLFVLIPVSTKISDTEEQRNKYFNHILERMELQLRQDIRQHVEVKAEYARSNFISDYNSYSGNAYGLANTLGQTAFLKPKMRSTKVENLYFTGQLTVPGPGLPPSIISGETVAKLVHKRVDK